jgi:hypothetical protein
MRLDEPEQVDMVLGDGARDRGATANLISNDPATGAGVAVRLTRMCPRCAPPCWIPRSIAGQSLSRG